MTSSVKSIALEKLIAHPDNPNRMSKAVFNKLVRNIERTGRYEPLVVRPHPEQSECFQIINGHHRCRALSRLGYKEADAVVWDIDDEQTDILLATLNRLKGSDELCRKVELLKRLRRKVEPVELAKFLPQTAKQIERLSDLRLPTRPANVMEKAFANPMVFFLTGTQYKVVESALLFAKNGKNRKRKIVKNGEALTAIAEYFLNNATADSEKLQ